jgi:hypothetical protein
MNTSDSGTGLASQDLQAACIEARKSGLWPSHPLTEASARLLAGSVSPTQRSDDNASSELHDQIALALYDYLFWSTPEFSLTTQDMDRLWLKANVMADLAEGVVPLPAAVPEGVMRVVEGWKH